MSLVKITYIDGTPWTNNSLANMCGISLHAASVRLKKYRNGELSADQTLIDVTPFKVEPIGHGIEEINTDTWRNKKTALLATALCWAALLPTAQASTPQPPKFCLTRIIVTQDSSPFLKAVNITLYRGNQRIGYTPRSSVRWPLKCGAKYRAVARSDQQIAKRYFYAAEQIVEITLGGQS